MGGGGGAGGQGGRVKLHRKGKTTRTPNSKSTCIQKQKIIKTVLLSVL